jgi:transforming growth factor-beta-induced protein
MTDRVNLIETIAKEDKFSTFSRLLGTSGASVVFSGDGAFTVFAPTNDAFGKVPDARMNELLQEPDQRKLKALLSYHILPGKWMAANLGAMPLRKSVTGQDIAFSDLKGLKVNGSGVQARNIEATNGVVHQIDTVLTQPPNAAVSAARAFAASAAKSTTPADVPATTPTVAPTAIPAAVPAASAWPAKHLL